MVERTLSPNGSSRTRMDASSSCWSSRDRFVCAVPSRLAISDGRSAPRPTASSTATAFRPSDALVAQNPLRLLFHVGRVSQSRATPPAPRRPARLRRTPNISGMPPTHANFSNESGSSAAGRRPAKCRVVHRLDVQELAGAAVQRRRPVEKQIVHHPRARPATNQQAAGRQRMVQPPLQLARQRRVHRSQVRKLVQAQHPAPLLQGKDFEQLRPGLGDNLRFQLGAEVGETPAESASRAGLRWPGCNSPSRV